MEPPGADFMQMQTLPGEPNAALTPRIADGLDWPLRLAVAWQRVDAAQEACGRAVLRTGGGGAWCSW